MASILHLLNTRQEAGKPPPPTGINTGGVKENEVKIIAASAFTIFLAMASTALRFMARKRRDLKWQADDYWMLVSAIIISADAVCYIAAIKYGFGSHMESVPPENLGTFFKIVYSTFMLYGGAVATVKFSVLSFYHRTFPVQDFRKWLYLYGTLNIVWFMLISCFSTFQCKPVKKLWDDSISGRCLNYLHVFLGIQAANIALDIAILVLPIRAVLKLHISRPKKIGVTAVFALGGMSVVLAIIRLAVLIRDQWQTDITFGTDTALWSLIEPAFQIFCACLPCLIPFFKSITFPAWMSTTMFASSAKRSGQAYGAYENTEDSSQRKHTKSGAVTVESSITVEQNGYTESKQSSMDDIPLAPRIYAANGF